MEDARVSEKQDTVSLRRDEPQVRPYWLLHAEAVTRGVTTSQALIAQGTLILSCMHHKKIGNQEIVDSHHHTGMLQNSCASPTHGINRTSNQCSINGDGKKMGTWIFRSSNGVQAKLGSFIVDVFSDFTSTLNVTTCLPA